MNTSLKDKNSVTDSWNVMYDSHNDPMYAVWYSIGKFVSLKEKYH